MISYSVESRESLVKYLIKEENAKRPRTLSWVELEKKFKIKQGKSPGQRARLFWRWYLNFGQNQGVLYPKYLDKIIPEGSTIKDLALKSRWQVQVKGGGTKWLESYKSQTDVIELEEYTNYVLASFKESVKNIKPVKLKQVAKSNKRALFLYTSDKHIGAHTKKASMYKNDYNPEIVRQRFEKLKRSIVEEYELYGVFDKISLIDLGDPLDGMGKKTLRGGHTLPQNLDDREQFDTYVKIHIDFFNWLLSKRYGKAYEFICATNDNHSGAFGYIGNRGVEIYLNARFPDVYTRLSNKFMFHTVYGKHAFIFTHGKDEEDLKHGMPLHLNPKVEEIINAYIDYNKLYDYSVHLVKGDLHQSSTEYGKRFRYKNVMSFYGASKWIHTNFGPGESGIDYEIVYADTNKIVENRLVF